MRQAAPSTTATRPAITIQTPQATNVSQATSWEVLEASRRTQLIKCLAELIRRFRDTRTIDEGGLDESR